MQTASKCHKNHLKLAVAGGGANGIKTPHKTSSSSPLHAREVVAVWTTSKKQRRNARQSTSGLLLHVREVEGTKSRIIRYQHDCRDWGSIEIVGELHVVWGA